MLKEHLPTILGDSGIFWQDNAPIHIARIVKSWLKEENITLFEWPPYSPDLNPMENLWGPLKSEVYKQDCGLLKARGSRSEIRERLIAASSKSWEAIEEQHFKTLAESMPRHCQAVIDAGGWYTGY